MDKRIMMTANSPLLYITQPTFTEVKPKMQQTCVVRPNRQMLPAAKESVPEVEKAKEKDEVLETIDIPKVELEPKDEKVAIKPSVEQKVPTNNKTAERVTPKKNMVLEQQSPTENKIIEKATVTSNNTDIKSNPIINQIIDQFAQFHNGSGDQPTALETKIIEKLTAIENKIKEEQTFIKNQQNDNSDVLQHNEQLPENPNVSKNEHNNIKRNTIATYGLKSSFEKGIKASTLRKEQVKRNNTFLLGVKSSIEKGRNVNKLNNSLPKVEQSHELEQVQDYQEEVPQISEQQNELEIQQQQVSDEKMAPVQNMKRFKDLSIEEKINYLLHLPLGVPKIKCEFETETAKFQGIVIGYANGVVQIAQKRKPFKVNVNVEDILSINRKSF